MTTDISTDIDFLTGAVLVVYPGVLYRYLREYVFKLV